MDSFELNKIIGAILGTLLFVMGAGFLAEAIYAPIEGRGPGYDLPEPEATHSGGEDIVEEPQVSLGTLLAAANVAQGESAVRKCQSCHNFGEGDGNKQGPVLFGVAGRQIASVDGFAYGDALAAMGAAGDAWTYEHLDTFLAAPKDFAPQTKMNFGGVKSPEERANILAYLASISPGAPGFPAPAPAEGETAEADAGAAVETDAEAVETPTETQTDSSVVGTPVTETAPDATTEDEPAAEETVPEVPAQ